MGIYLLYFRLFILFTLYHLSNRMEVSTTKTDHLSRKLVKQHTHKMFRHLNIFVIANKYHARDHQFVIYLCPFETRKTFLKFLTNIFNKHGKQIAFSNFTLIIAFVSYLNTHVQLLKLVSFYIAYTLQ